MGKLASEAPNGGPPHAFPLLEEESCQDPCTSLPGGVKYQCGLQGTQGHVAYKALRDKALLWPTSAVLGPGYYGMKYRRLQCTIQALELARGTFPLCLVLGVLPGRPEGSLPDNPEIYLYNMCSVF